MKEVKIIMPVKDSVETTERAVWAIVESGYKLTIYDDYSTAENAALLDDMAIKYGIEVLHLSAITTHPSPNYRLVLNLAQENAIENNRNLIIIESDVIVKRDTIDLMRNIAEQDGVGLVAAVTEDEQGEVNFPYLYLKKKRLEGVESTKKRLSFCCTLLTNNFLKAYSFKNLDPEKNWYDVQISHKSIDLGFNNLLMLGDRVLHLPHSSRPWKKLKYTNPLKYYWQKLWYGRDKI